MKEKKPGISVIIPMYNASATIAECLESVSKLEYPKEKFEAVIVNDGSTDNSAELSKQFIKKFKNFRLLDLGKNRGKITAREEGVKAAKYRLVAFTDTDCRVDKNWLKELANSESAQVIGVTFNNPKRSEIDLFFHLVRSRYYYWPKKLEPISWKNFDKIPKGTENFLCDKKLFLESSPSNKQRGVNDDTLIMSNILKKGKPLMISPKANVTHLERNSRKAVFRQWQLRGITFWNYFIEERKNKGKALLAIFIAWVFTAVLAAINPLILLYLALALIILDFLSGFYFVEKAGQLFRFWEVGLFAKTGFASGIISRNRAVFSLWALSLIALALAGFFLK